MGPAEPIKGGSRGGRDSEFHFIQRTSRLLLLLLLFSPWSNNESADIEFVVVVGGGGDGIT